MDGDDSVRAAVTRARLTHARLTEQLRELRAPIGSLVHSSRSTLPESTGRPVVAATIIGHVAMCAAIRPGTTRHANGTAPIPRLVGRTVGTD